jgi:hypothetical protein
VKNFQACNTLTMSAVAQHLSYLPRFQVVVCLTCKFCIRPNGSYDHFRRWHKELGREVRKELEEYCNGLDLVEPKDVVNPVDKVAIQGLELHNGNKCDVLGCNYICVKESMAMAHGRLHGWLVGRPRTWVKTHTQVH